MSLSILKIGGSVLTGAPAYRRAAEHVAATLCARPGERIIAVVSAEHGVTDGLEGLAREIVEEPDPATLDLLWSTGEARSAAVLALELQARGVRVRAVNVHETGLDRPGAPQQAGVARVTPLRLRALLGSHDVVVAPGFFARGTGDAIVSLGRGGSDLTAVLLAVGLQAARCTLVKDVPGYFTADPKRDPSARPVGELTFARALEMADTGCELVQKHALEAARDHNMPIVVTAIGHQHHTLIH